MQQVDLCAGLAFVGDTGGLLPHAWRERVTTIGFVAATVTVEVAIALPLRWDAVPVVADKVTGRASTYFGLVFAMFAVLKLVTHVQIRDALAITTKEAFLALTAVHLVFTHVAIVNAVTNEHQVDTKTFIALELVRRAVGRRSTYTVIFILAVRTVRIAVANPVLHYTGAGRWALEKVIGAGGAAFLVGAILAVDVSVADPAAGDTRSVGRALEP